MAGREAEANRPSNLGPIAIAQNDLRGLTLQLIGAGLSVVPVLADGSKRPAVTWRRYRERPPLLEEVRSWPDGCGLAAVCGEVSGRLEVIDFDDFETFERFRDRFLKMNPGLFEALIEVATPRPGRHLIYRCPAGIEPSQPLARRIIDGSVRTLIETRGEGGLALLPGSPPSCHPNGSAYRLVRGRWEDLPGIKPEERLLLLETAQSFNEYVPSASIVGSRQARGNRPGDDFARRVDWAGILEASGWVCVTKRPDNTIEWRRPGKSDPGISATTGFGGADLLYVFSNNAQPLEAGRAYGKFAAWTLLQHNGDFSSAAKDLAKRGFGGHPEITSSDDAPGTSCAVSYKPVLAQNGRSRTSFASFASLTSFDTEVLHGLAGRVVRLIEPHTEADPAAVLVQFLVAFGNAAGRSPHFMVEATRHGTNLFAVVVGKTSRARKGTSWDWVKRLLRLADPEWADRRLKSGLTSGEGLIHVLRDSDTPTFEAVDKRLLVFESEFSRVLRVGRRQGNILSPVLRDAWDGGDLSVLTKNAPARATGSHISVVGHITAEELLRRMEGAEYSGGFANRFLWCYARRSKLLPDGGSLSEEDLKPVAEELAEALRFARSQKAMYRDDEASGLWREVYPALTEERVGLLGSVTSRAEAQTTRLATVFALLDRSSVVRRTHLEAALAVWRRCDRSCVRIFGASTGDPVAERLFEELRNSAEGLSRTEISDRFGRHRSAAQIDRALQALSSLGVAKKQVRKTAGRPREIWRFAGRNDSTDIE